jgi:hypothetical protein
VCVCVDAGGVGAVEGAGVGGCVLCVCISLSVCVRVCKEELLLVGGAGVCVRVLCVYVCLCIEELMLLRELLVHSLSLSHTHTHTHQLAVRDKEWREALETIEMYKAQVLAMEARQTKSAPKYISYPVESHCMEDF